MIIREIYDATKAEKRKLRMFLLGALFVLVASPLAYFFGGLHASIISVILTSIFVIPLFYKIIKLEEKKDIKEKSELKLLKEHTKAIRALILLFIGMVFGFAIVFLVTPADNINVLFDSQLNTLQNIQESLPTGMVVDESSSTFNFIFFNNLRVLILSILFSFFLGAGAIFILTWNAAIIGVAIGSFIRPKLILANELLGAERLVSYFQTISTGFLMYSLHGVVEIAAYFVAALAGGIISVAIIRKDFRSAKFESIVYDVTILFILSVFLLLIAALLEVFVTPLIFN